MKGGGVAQSCSAGDLVGLGIPLHVDNHLLEAAPDSPVIVSPAPTGRRTLPVSEVVERAGMRT